MLEGQSNPHVTPSGKPEINIILDKDDLVIIRKHFHHLCTSTALGAIIDQDDLEARLFNSHERPDTFNCILITIII